jgi:endogenous inhibitor of DNA gyrase (YacG/DUF329 family)
VTKRVPALAYPNAKQHDHVADEQACPTCGKPWGEIAVRVCRKCGKPIARGHRWKMIPVGPMIFSIQHRNCDMPTSSV